MHSDQFVPLLAISAIKISNSPWLLLLVGWWWSVVDENKSLEECTVMFHIRRGYKEIYVVLLH